MKQSNKWMIVVMIATGLQLSACGQGQVVESESEPPIHVEVVDGSDLKREILTEQAAERLGIETVEVREEQVTRKQVVGAEIVDVASADPKTAYVRVRLNASDLDKIDLNQTALVRPLEDTDEANTWEAQQVENPPYADGENQENTIYYTVDNSANRLTAKQRIFIELTLKGSGSQQKVIPYSAILYDTQGATWVYMSADPLTYVRTPVVVEYIDGDMAILSDGPPAGTAVVTVGGQELYGAEFEFEEE